MCKHTLEVTTAIENMSKVIAFAEENTKFLENRKAARQLAIVTEELAVNIFNYAYGGQRGKFTFSITNDHKERRIIMEFRDSGSEFNPLLREEPDITKDIFKREIGGLGIMMSKKLTDEQHYVRENGQNVLTVIKKY
jgi:anti-sigma regulatory factor (Ser/Thr protein kinase)